MTDAVAETIRQLDQLRTKLSRGELYQRLPQEVGELIDQLPHEKRTPIVVPTDDEAALVRIKALRTKIKQKKITAISDAEIDFLLAHLASTDPMVRDKGVYFLFNDILQARLFTADQIKQIYQRLLSPEMLYGHILETKSNAVFLRSFSVMILSGVLYVDRLHYHVLQPADLEDVSLKIAAYIAMEADGRGYIGNRGWAHAYSHVGNVLDELTESAALNRANKLFYLTVLLARYQRLETPLIFGEDHRLALTIANLVNKNQLYADYFLRLLQYWQRELMEMRPQENEGFWNCWYNRNRLLQALIIRGDLPQKIQDFLVQIVDVF
ncbi:DUF2785 domain-containing protein [Loigolactobacillus zhaoyuanensis]|uniref:DUF2785 domain-containing protein n=1 Tax=Loigolactobacillus zhaoyuanensis TaxID=2486017 RepID=A0ABW8UF06_9LACO|nr:DUF2785 domain-containing protein [Loigolactobacillus zhaoyuanensis]